MSADAFALLHAFRGLAAAEHEREKLAAFDRRVRARIEAGEEGWQTLTPDGIAERIAEEVLPPLDLDALDAPPLTEAVQWLGGRAVRLLHVATGDTRHADDPAAWMASRGWVAYRVQDGRVGRWLATMAGAWRLTMADPAAHVAFADCALDAWEAHLVAHEWESVHDAPWPLPGYAGARRPMRAPSGKVYPLWAADGSGAPSSPAVDVALARGGFDVAAELARGDAAIARVRERAAAMAPPKRRRRK